MKFDSRISIVRLLETENRPIVGFETYGVKEIAEDPDDPRSDSITVKCEDNEAQAWGIYARVQDGAITVPLWLIDVEDKSHAQRLCGLLNDLKKELGKPGVDMEKYYHGEQKYNFGNNGNGYLS